MTAIDNTEQPDGTIAKARPGDDLRFTIPETTMKRHHYQPDALIEVFHTAQEVFGYLSTDLLIRIAHSLTLPPSQVYGVATFYHFFARFCRGPFGIFSITWGGGWFGGGQPPANSPFPHFFEKISRSHC